MNAAALAESSPVPATGARAGRPSRGYIPTLDGWRALAIVWVIYAHYGRSSGPLSHRLQLWGDHGVELFFALSGFLICTLLLREEERTGTLSLKSFYTRRLFRIQPPILAYLAFIAVLTLLHVIPPYWKGMVAALLMVRNIWPQPVGHVYWYTSHFWSLSVEEHFYLFLPGFLLLVRRQRLRILAIAVVLCAIWYDIVFAHPSLQTFGWLVDLRTDVKIGGILIGSVAALALQRPRLRAAAVRWIHPWAVVLYAALVYTFFDFHLRRFQYQVSMTTYPLLLVASTLHPESPIGRLLELPAVRFIGRISYSLYIWQQFWMYPPYWAPELPMHHHPYLSILCTFACGVASYYLVEQPVIRFGHRISKRFDSSSKASRPQTA